MNMAFELKAARLADIPLQEASLNIWDTKYRLKTKSGDPVDRDVEPQPLRVLRCFQRDVPEGQHIRHGEGQRRERQEEPGAGGHLSAWWCWR